MKLFVWEGVLASWSDGLAVAIAKNLEQVLEMAREQSSYVAGELGSHQPEVIDLGRIKREPKLWYVCGGD